MSMGSSSSSKPKRPVGSLLFLGQADIGKGLLSRAGALGFVAEFASTVDDAKLKLQEQKSFDVIVVDPDIGKDKQRGEDFFTHAQACHPKLKHRPCYTTFFIAYSATASNSPAARQRLTDQFGVNMVTQSEDDIIATIAKVPTSGQGQFKCPWCGLAGLQEDELWTHCPMFHSNFPNKKMKSRCPICSQRHGRLQVHIRNAHGPPGRGDMHSELIGGVTELYTFALVICRNPLDGRYLMVQEYGQEGYWIPGGRVDGAETLQQAAIRETKEEAGIDVKLTGVLRFQYVPHCDRKGSAYVRLRAIFLAEPVNPHQLPKSIPDYESVGAIWTSVDELAGLSLRGPEPLHWFPYVDNGGAVSPMSVLDCVEK